MESDKSHKHLTLAEAQRLGQIEEFVEQETARGVGPASSVGFESAISHVIKAGKSEGQTSRSASSDGIIPFPYSIGQSAFATWRARNPVLRAP